MPQSLSCVYIHFIFSTKERYPFIYLEIELDLHAYMAGILHHKDCPVIIINGTTDHVHILCKLSRTITIAKLVEEVKKNSSKWIKTKSSECISFQWQSAYGVFSVSESKVKTVQRYIQKQKEHHQTVSFQEEFKEFLQAYQIEYDERYVWD